MYLLFISNVIPPLDRSWPRISCVFGRRPVDPFRRVCPPFYLFMFLFYFYFFDFFRVRNTSFASFSWWENSLWTGVFLCFRFFAGKFFDALAPFRLFFAFSFRNAELGFWFILCFFFMVCLNLFG